MSDEYQKMKQAFDGILGAMEQIISMDYEEYSKEMNETMVKLDNGEYLEVMGFKKIAKIYSNRKELDDWIFNQQHLGISYDTKKELLTDFYHCVLEPKAKKHWKLMRSEMMKDGFLKYNENGQLMITEKLFDLMKENYEQIKGQYSQLKTLKDLSTTFEYYITLDEGDEKDLVATKLVIAKLEIDEPEIHICPLCNKIDDCDNPFGYLYRRGLIKDILVEKFGNNPFDLFDNEYEYDENNEIEHSHYDGMNYT